LVGIDDDGLAQICSSNADNISFNWRKRNGFAKADFSNAVSLMKTRLTDVASIEINSTMVSYWSGKEKNNPDYIEGYWTEACPECIPPIESEWIEPVGEEFIPLTYDDRVPVDFRYAGANAFTSDMCGQAFPTAPFIQRYNDGDNTYPEANIYRNINTSLVESYSPTIVIKNSSGTDISENYDDELKLAIISMILINGSAFMTETGSLTKVSEVSADEGLSYIVTGKQTFSGTINQSFIDDISDTYWYAHTQPNSSQTDRIFPRIYFETDLGYITSYGQHFWYWRDNNLTDVDIETNSNGLFTTTSTPYENGEVYLTVEGFKRCSYEDYGRWIFAMANITQSMDSSGFLGIGGFFGDLLKAIVTIVGTILGVIIDVFKKIALLTLKITGIYYVMVAVGLEDFIDLTTEIMAHIALAILTLGVSEYIQGVYLTSTLSSIAVESTAFTAYTTSEIAVNSINAGVQGLIESGITGMALKTATTAYGVVSSEQQTRIENKQKELDRQREKKVEDELETYKSLSNREETSSSNEELINELNFNPFKRFEVKESLKY